MIFFRKKKGGKAAEKERSYSQFGLKLNAVLQRMPLQRQYMIAKALMLVLLLFIGLRLAIYLHSVYTMGVSLAALIVIAGVAFVGYRMVKKSKSKKL